MFSNGKFKNIVSETEINENIAPSQSLNGTYPLLPLRGATKNWIAVEGSLFSSSHHDTSLEALNSKLASSTPQNAMYFATKHSQDKSSFCEHRKLPIRHHTIAHVESGGEEATSVTGCIGNYTEKNVFAINVSYYVKIKLSFSSIGSDISLKLPFFLGNVCDTNENAQKKLFLQENLRLTNEPSKNYCTTADNNTEFIYEGCSSEVTAVLNDRRNEYEQSLGSSASDLELNRTECKQESVVQAQIHERKYLESDM